MGSRIFGASRWKRNSALILLDRVIGSSAAGSVKRAPRTTMDEEVTGHTERTVSDLRQTVPSDKLSKGALTTGVTLRNTRPVGQLTGFPR